MCFGSLTLYMDGVPLRIPSRKAGELLALLLLQKGRPLRKTVAAETLWPESDAERAMDSLYKVCGVLHSLKYLPLEAQRDVIWLDDRGIDSDFAAFERFYKAREDLDCCRAAIDLYTDPLLIHEYYEWTARAEAYYDIRYMELLALAAQRLAGTPAGRYYSRLQREYG